ncbi:MAG: ogr/Delta-like zinc finger family protein [Hydrogenophaga sp.]|nr:ogr/Delta-like zinc finger family protein [Hydrogenophaga sp.]
MSALQCPHCEASSYVRSSEQLSPLLRKSWHRCSNSACGHTFVSFTEIRYTLSPSAAPRPGVWLPLSQHVQRKELAHVLKWAPQAQDNPPPQAVDPPP